MLDLLDEDEKGTELADLDPGQIETEILEPKREAASQRVFEELSYRQRVLSDRYPFEVGRKGGFWVLTRRPAKTSGDAIAHSVYLASLAITAGRTGIIPFGRSHRLTRSMDKIMQIISYLVAPEIVSGEAYWFGHPRPDRTGMTAATQTLVSRMGFGLAHPNRPPGVTRAAKDGTIDLVAWRSFADRKFGALVLYGQVASGKNWPDKPVHSHLNDRFFPWFIEAPATKKHLEALFIPFLQHHEIPEDKKYAFQTNALQESRHKAKTYGMIVDRIRLTELSVFAFANRRGDRDEAVSLGLEVLRWTRESKAFAST